MKEKYVNASRNCTHKRKENVIKLWGEEIKGERKIKKKNNSTIINID